MYLVKTPEALKPLASDLLWNMDKNFRDIYVTFDDGPTPDVTSRILDILDHYDAKATFFCIGGNVEKHPEAYDEISIKGHVTGNHTWNHMSGWEFRDFAYYRNVLECVRVVKSDLFRPPYGRITRSQVKGLKKRFQIVMWDVLSGDWEQKNSSEQCFQNVTQHAKSGSIVVFHDSEKAKGNMLSALPRALEFWKTEGYQFKAIPAASQI